MEPTLVVIGISCQSAALATRERFWLDEARRRGALQSLVQSEGIDEVVVISNCSRTEFVIWSQDAGEAANSVLRCLTRACNLKLSDWSSFHRLLDDEALTHLCRVASGLDALFPDRPAIAGSLARAWEEARNAGATGHFLDATLHKALEVSKELQQQVEGQARDAAVAEAAREKLQGVAHPRITILGAGEVAGAAARAFCSAGLGDVVVLSRRDERAKRLVETLDAHAGRWAELRRHLRTADLLVAATTAHPLLTRAEIENALQERSGRRLLIFDLGFPRNIDPTVRELSSITLYDVDELCRDPAENAGRLENIKRSDAMVRAAVAGFHSALLAEQVQPTLQALRARLGQMCEQEVGRLTEEFGPFTGEQAETLRVLSAHITQRIAASLARRLKEMPDCGDGKMALASALQELFELEVGRSVSAVKP